MLAVKPQRIGLAPKARNLKLIFWSSQLEYILPEIYSRNIFQNVSLFFLERREILFLAEKSFSSQKIVFSPEKEFFPSRKTEKKSKNFLYLINTHLNLVRIHVGQIDAANLERRIGQNGLMQLGCVVQMVVVQFAGNVAPVSDTGGGSGPSLVAGGRAGLREEAAWAWGERAEDEARFALGQFVELEVEFELELELAS